LISKQWAVAGGGASGRSGECDGNPIDFSFCPTKMIKKWEKNPIKQTFKFGPNSVGRLFDIGHQIFQFLLDLCNEKHKIQVIPGERMDR
jgi:hypothetical protein